MRNFTRSALILLACIGPSLALAAQNGPAQQQPQLPPNAQQPGQLPIYTALYGVPGVQNITAPPAWVKPGMQFTLWGGSATTQDHAFRPTLTPAPGADPNDPNTLRDPETGQTFTKSESPGGMGSVGFLQIDIVAVSEQGVLMQLSNYLHDGSMAAPTLLATTTFACHPSGCEYWIHPDALRSLAQMDPNTFISHWNVHGQARPAAIIRESTGHVVYDAETGIQLSYGFKTTHNSTARFYNESTQTYTTGATGGSSIVQFIFHSSRETWRTQLANMPLPPVVDQINGIEVHVSQTFEMGGGLDAGGPQQMLSAIIHTTPIRRNGNVIAMQITPQQMQPQGAMQPMRTATTPAAIGPSFLPQQFLQGLQQGQALDEDQVTGYTTSVTYVGADNNGRPVVAITAAGQTESTTWLYDLETGMMTYMERVDRSAGIVTTRASVTRVW